MSEKSGFAAMLDLEHPVFLPLWRRVLLVAVCLGWATVEFVGGYAFWGIIFGAAGLYAAWSFFVTWDAEAVAAKRKDQG